MPRARQTATPVADLPLPLAITHDLLPGDSRSDGMAMSLVAVEIGGVTVHVYEALSTPGKVIIDVLEQPGDVTPFKVVVNDDDVFERKGSISLPRATRHALESAVRADVRNHYGETGYRLDDPTAAAIASWYQDPVTGMEFAEFVSHSPVDPEALALACEREIAAHTGRADWTVRALKMLAAYARSA